MTHSWRTTATMAAVAGAVITTVAAQPGPTWLWAADACPSSQITCGHPPVGLLVIAGVMAGANVVVERIGKEEAIK